jgi:hypothetical protein
MTGRERRKEEWTDGHEEGRYARLREGIYGEGLYQGSGEGKTAWRTEPKKYTNEWIRNEGPYEGQNEDMTT